MLWERLALRWSTSRTVDGLWIGIVLQKKQTDRAFDRVEEALRVIKQHDPLRYKRLLRDLRRVWVLRLPEVRGSYNQALGACQLDSTYVLGEGTAPEEIASTIVHEATHARLMSCGIGYEEGLRSRVETVCSRRELAFARKLPDGRLVREKAQRSLAWYRNPAYANYSTNQEFEKRFVNAKGRHLRDLGVPHWFVRMAFSLRALRLRLRGARLRRRIRRPAAD